MFVTAIKPHFRTPPDVAGFCLYQPLHELLLLQVLAHVHAKGKQRMATISLRFTRLV